MEITPDKIVYVVQMLVILILSVCVHEFGHAWVAAKLGDRTPVAQGRVTLNPMAHADPIGTIAFPVIGALAGGAAFGWGKPVEVYPPSFTRKLTMRTGHMLVALAGPMMNLLFGTLIFLVHVALFHAGVLAPDSRVHEVLLAAVFLNFVLMIFNLIPAPPLDGGAVVEGFMPAKWLPNWRKFSVYGPFVLMAFIFIPVLGRALTVPAQFLMGLLYGLGGMPFA